MSERDTLLTEIQYLTHELNEHLLDTMFLELYANRRFPSNSRVSAVRQKITRLLELEEGVTLGANGKVRELVEHQNEDTPALPEPEAPKGRGPNKVKAKDITAEQWRTEFLQWALDHDDVIDTDVYRAEKFRKEYPKEAFSRTRGSNTLTYGAGTQKLWKGNGSGHYILTPKGRELAKELGITPKSVQSAPQETSPVTAELPEKFAKGGLISRAFDAAKGSGGTLDVTIFSRDERKRGGSPGVPKLMKDLLRSKIFSKVDETHVQIAGITQKSMAAGA